MSNGTTGYVRIVSLIYVNVGLCRGFRRLGGGYRGSGSPEQDDQFGGSGNILQLPYRRDGYSVRYSSLLDL